MTSNDFILDEGWMIGANWLNFEQIFNVRDNSDDKP